MITQFDDPRLEEILNVISRLAAGDLTARGTLSGDDSALDGVVAGVNSLGEELQTRVAETGQAQQALSECEARFSGIFTAAQDGILMAETETRRFRMANAAICRMLGYSHDELLNLTINDIHPQKDLPDVARQFEQQLKGEILLATLPVKRKDGSVFHADISAAPVAVGGQKYLTGVFRDVTERNLAEEEIRKLNQALQGKMQQLLEAQDELMRHHAHLEQEVVRQTASLTEAQRLAHLGNWEWDIVKDHLYFSDELYRIFDLNPQQFKASYEAFLSVVHPKDRQLVDDMVRGAMDKRLPYIIDYRILLPDGTLRFVHAQGEVIFDQNGAPVKMQGTVQDITKSKSAAESLRQSEEKFRSMVEWTSDWIWEIDQNGRYTYASPRVEALLGYKSEEIIGKSPFDFMPPEEQQRLGNAFSNVIAAREPFVSLQNTNLRKDGRLVVLETSGVPFFGEDGDFAGYRGVDRDITERKQMEDTLRDSEERFRSISATAQDAVVMLDNDGNIFFWNTAAEKIFGYTSAEVIGKEFHRLVAPARYLDAHYAGFRHFQATGEGPVIGKTLELSALRKDGSEFPIELSLSAVKLKGKWNAIGISRDITERKQVEEAIQASRDLLQTILDNAPIRVFWKDSELRYLGCNTAFARDAGKNSPDELLGKDDFQMNWHDQAELYRADDKMVMDSNTPKIGFEEPQTTPDGRTMWLRTSKVPLHDAAGKVFGMVGIYDDITVSKNAEDTIRKLNEELENKVLERTRQLLEAQEALVRKEKLATLGQVAGIVGHELRNPLGVMNNAVYFLQAVLTEADETTKEYLGIIKEEITSADRIVGDLLDSVRTKPPQLEPVGVDELIRQTLRKYAIPASVSVSLDIPETLPPLLVDAQQIQQVLRNLVSNGAESMPEGGTLEIRALENRPGKTITISVHDSGSGMTPEQLAHLFQPLFTTKARGLGLGLMVVKNLISTNGGTVAVQSEPGKGSTFTVTLPCSNLAAASA